MEAALDLRTDNFDDLPPATAFARVDEDRRTPSSSATNQQNVDRKNRHRPHERKERSEVHDAAITLLMPVQAVPPSNVTNPRTWRPLAKLGATPPAQRT